MTVSNGIRLVPKMYKELLKIIFLLQSSTKNIYSSQKLNLICNQELQIKAITRYYFTCRLAKIRKPDNTVFEQKREIRTLIHW